MKTENVSFVNGLGWGLSSIHGFVYAVKSNYCVNVFAIVPHGLSNASILLDSSKAKRSPSIAIIMRLKSRIIVSK